MRADALLYPAPEGLYCPEGGFFVDPVRPVERALVTHGHSDHARPGHVNVLATRQTLDIMRLRYGDGFCASEQIANLGEELLINGVKVGDVKRVYTDGNGSFVSLFGRLSYGAAVGYLNLNGESWFYRNDYRYSTHTAELDFQAMYLGRLARKLGYYFNAGPSLGKIDYELDGREGRNDASGSLPIYGLRLHAGMVFELRRFELAWETGLQTFNYGMTPSLGVRACFKTDWRR